jgi:hypothetical protein
MLVFKDEEQRRTEKKRKEKESVRWLINATRSCTVTTLKVQGS